MITWICIFFPALIALGLYERMTHTHLETRKLVYLYALLNLCTNLTCFAVKVYVLGTGRLHLDDGLGDMNPHSAMNYLIMAVPIALFFAIAWAWFGKRADLRIEVDNHEGKK